LLCPVDLCVHVSSLECGTQSHYHHHNIAAIIIINFISGIRSISCCGCSLPSLTRSTQIRLPKEENPEIGSCRSARWQLHHQIYPGQAPDPFWRKILLLASFSKNHKIKTDNTFFEDVGNLKYFGRTVPNQNYIHEEIKRKLSCCVL
jgi:hypothetical protein